MTRSVAELLNAVDPAWPVLRDRLAEAGERVLVLPRERPDAERTLHHVQVTVGSSLGAIAYETGGVLIDSGWLRLHGAGSPRMLGSLRSWSDGSVDLFGLSGRAIVVAHDAVGGFFALNGGAFDGNPGDVHYLSPHSLQWEDLELGYSDFLSWAIEGDLEDFYADSRWPGWREQVAPLSGDQAILIYPPLWAAEGGDLMDRTRKPVPVIELWGLSHEWRTQLGLTHG